MLLCASLVLLDHGIAGAAPSELVPLKGADRTTALADRYLVIFKPGVSTSDVDAVREKALAQGGQLHFQYGHALQGFAASLPAQALDAVRRNGNVAYVEVDAEVRGYEIQPGSTWGLDRIDQWSPSLNGSYNYSSAGAGVTAYVIDSGIRTTHGDFGGRATAGYTSINDGRGAQDCTGHGTHVAGTLGGRTYGVAKAVSLIAVRVLDCDGRGSLSGIVAGIDWVTAHHQPGIPAVANMSLGGGASDTVDAATTSSINDGITYVVAAGNDNLDACTVSPARAPAAVTVGASEIVNGFDVKSDFSNWGTCLDLYAPGSDITSAWHTTDSAINTIPGTSMASPHVAGAAAVYLSNVPSAGPEQVQRVLKARAGRDVSGNNTYIAPRLLHIPPIWVSIGGVDVTEGSWPNAVAATLKVTRSGWGEGSSSVQYATRDGSATAANGDYSSAQGTIEFGPGEREKTVNVTVHGDPQVEAHEDFSVVLTSATRATLSPGSESGRVRIFNDEPVQTFWYYVGNTVTNGVPAYGAGNIEFPGASDRYSFDAWAGQPLYVDKINVPCGDLEWTVTDPAGRVVLTLGRTSCVDPGTFVPATTGTYTLTVNSPGPSTFTGTYTFRVTRAYTQSFWYYVGNTVTNGVPAYGAGNIESAGSIDRYNFTGSANQRVLVEWLAGARMDWKLIGPSGATVASGRFGWNQWVTLPVAGTYGLMVSDTVWGTTGTYTFRVNT